MAKEDKKGKDSLLTINDGDDRWNSGNGGYDVGSGSRPPASPITDITNPTTGRKVAIDDYVYLIDPGQGSFAGAVPPDNPKRKLELTGAHIVPVSATMKLINFALYTESNENLGKCRIEIEFYKDLMLPRGRNHFVEKLKYDASQPYPYMRDASAYCFNRNVNFDDESLNNFTLVIKDWDDFSNESAVASTKYLPTYILNKDEGYSASMFVLTKQNGTIVKTWIGNLDFSRFAS